MSDYPRINIQGSIPDNEEIEIIEGIPNKQIVIEEIIISITEEIQEPS